MAQIPQLLGFSLNTLILLVGTILVLAEAVIPGAQFIVVGVALLLTGLVGVAVPAIGSSVILLSVVFFILSVLTFLGYSRLNLYEGDSNVVGTSDTNKIEGVKGVVIEDITPESTGKVDLNKSGFTTEYTAKSEFDETIPEGSSVRVVDSGGGSILTVQELEKDKIEKELNKLETEKN